MNPATSAGSGPQIAAFFDLDGTLLPLPSLERRFVRALRRQHAFPPQNYFRWLAQAVRLAPHGLGAMTHANKMYLRNAPVRSQSLFVGGTGSPVHAEPRSGYVPGTQSGAAARTARRCPAFFPEALDQIAWHIECSHAIVLVTGTLDFLAKQVSLALTLRLITRGITTSIAVCSTRLEQTGGRWTGRITGDAMFGEAKASALRKIAAENNFDLRRSYAYGDGTQDRWMLGAVGRPAAVNPSGELERIARLRHWPILHWKLNSGRNPQRPAPSGRPLRERG
jgi:HAD superfamily phosphoserine phosphatase-like hydrolase